MKTTIVPFLRMSTAGATKLLSLMLLSALPAAVHAQFQFVTNSGAITITKYTGPGGVVIIPSITNGYPVTSIGTNAFDSASSVISVTIPNSVTSIGNLAFFSCASLASVTLPDSVTYLGARSSRTALRDSANNNSSIS